MHSLKKGGNEWRCKTPQFAFYHSSLKNGPTNNTKIVIEVTVIQEVGMQKVGMCPAGYAVIDPFAMKETHYNVTSGSPRFIGKETQAVISQADRNGKTQIGVEIHSVQEYDALKSLVPQHCLISCTETIPGLLNAKFPAPVSLGIEPDWQQPVPSNRPV